MAEPATKKMKSDINAIFTEFRKDKKKFNSLKNAKLSFLHGLESMNIGVWHIDFANARISEVFSHASCRVNLYTESDANSSDKVFKICEIFQPGIMHLVKYLDESKPQVPEDEDHRSALEKLLKFLSTDHQSLFEKRNYEGKEGEWAITVAQHLLSPLAVANGYTIDSYHDLFRNSMQCPCEKEDDLQGEIGDTTFGCARGWHGRSDILMDEVTIELASSESGDTLSESFSTSSFAEMKSSKNFSDNDISRIISQTIVSSFYQRKKNKEKLKNLLIPGIGISTKSLVGFFYDCEEDVLLLTDMLDLAVGCYSDLNVCTVVFLWLTLNYKLFCSGITDEMKKYKADFFVEAGKLLDVYRNEVTRPVHKAREESEGYTKHSGFSKKMDQEEARDFELKHNITNYIDLKC